MKNLFTIILICFSSNLFGQDTINFEKLRVITTQLAQSAENRYEKPSTADNFYHEAVQQITPIFKTGHKYIVPIKYDEFFRIDNSYNNHPTFHIYEPGENVYPILDIRFITDKNTEYSKSKFATQNIFFEKLENLELELSEGQTFYILIEIVPSGYKSATYSIDKNNATIKLNIKILKISV